MRYFIDLQKSNGRGGCEVIQRCETGDLMQAFKMFDRYVASVRAGESDGDGVQIYGGNSYHRSDLLESWARF